MICYSTVEEPSHVSSEDFVVINRLLSQLSPGKEHHFGPAALANSLIQRSRLVIARDKLTGSIVGMAVLAKVAKVTRWHGEIHDVVVDQRYRGRYIGKELTRRVIELAREDSRLDHLELTSRPSRTKANSLYLSLGFQMISVPNPALPEGQGTNLYRLSLR